MLKDSFENDFGRINFNEVYIKETQEEFSFKKIALILIVKKTSFLVIGKLFIRIVFTNATSKYYLIKKKRKKDAIDFETQFLRLRNINTNLD
ncbi:hypothetical protein [Flavobacterium sp.]|uniref:hypothetical protein n=1 Tax=Flavobacterium sp. TaxID=239 RepID=UPI003753E0FD